MEKRETNGKNDDEPFVISLIPFSAAPGGVGRGRESLDFLILFALLSARLSSCLVNSLITYWTGRESKRDCLGLGLH